MASITAHVVFNHLRRRKTERGLFADLGDDVIADPRQQAPNRGASLRHALARVADLLREMDVGRARSFVLHDVLGFDLQEVATAQGITLAAAQSRLVRGRREIHERIAGFPDLAKVLVDAEVE